jgi:hypothetical protein
MILLDSDVLLIAHRYQNDRNFGVNAQALQQIKSESIALAMTSQAFLEVVGVLSYNVPGANVPRLPHFLAGLYGLLIFPDTQRHPDYAGCTVAELIAQMSLQMSLPDAVQAVQIARYASHADCLLTWNARHFRGKIVIPTFTPLEWLNQRASSKPLIP